MKDEWLLDIKEDHYFIHDLIIHRKNVIEGRASYNFLLPCLYGDSPDRMPKGIKTHGVNLYLHCDPTMSHYLKLLLDCIFGEANFRNEIIWCYTGPSNATRDFARKHDVIFRYVCSGDWVFNTDAVRVPYKKLNQQIGGGGIGGKLHGEYREAQLEKGKVPETWWDEFSPVGRIESERTGYPTQKPLALLERIIAASCPKGGIVLDPFCGCATTCVAAEKLGRSWVGVDVSIKAYELVKDRMKKEVEWEGSLFAEDLVDFQTRPACPHRFGCGYPPAKICLYYF